MKRYWGGGAALSGMRARVSQLRGGIAVALMILVSAVSGCSKANENLPDRNGRSAELRPSEAEVRAARLLSLSNNSALEAEKDPYKVAIACLVAIDALGTQLAGVTTLDDQQKQALVAARRIYERKALDASSKTAGQVAREVVAGQAQSDDLKQRLLTGISCLRRIA